ncbi:ABC transporter ATP-binding protein, partial [Lacticaseibacillus rhamnosus]
MSTLLKLKNVEKTYTSRGAQPVQALVNISFSVESGEFVAIMGESGSGKSTLLNLIATLDDPTGGEISLNGQDLRKVKEGARAKFRREHLGFIFQDFDLLDTFNVQDNIFLPLVLAKKPLEIMKNRLTQLAPRLGITDLLKKYPYELSGGQQQRVAAARAMITDP